MKQIKIVVPENMAQHVAKWTFENGVRVILSYGKDKLFETDIIIFLAVPEEKIEAANTEFKAYVKA